MGRGRSRSEPARRMLGNQFVWRPMNLRWAQFGTRTCDGHSLKAALPSPTKREMQPNATQAEIASRLMAGLWTGSFQTRAATTSAPCKSGNSAASRCLSLRTKLAAFMVWLLPQPEVSPAHAATQHYQGTKQQGRRQQLGVPRGAGMSCSDSLHIAAGRSGAVRHSLDVGRDHAVRPFQL